MAIQLGHREGCRVITDLVCDKLKKQAGVVVLIGGKYDTGKHELILSLQKRLGNEVVAFHENDFKKRSLGKLEVENPKDISWSRLLSVAQGLKNGEMVTKPKYDAQTHSLKGEETVCGKVVIVWGVFALHESLMKLADIRVYFEADKYTCLMRYFLSELDHLSPDEIVQSVINSHKTNKSYVEPTRIAADFVLVNNDQPSFSGKQAKKLVDHLRWPMRLDRKRLQKCGKIRVGDTRLQEEHYISSPSRTQIIRLRKRSIAFLHKDSKNNLEIWNEFAIAENLSDQLVEMYKKESYTISKLRTIFQIVGTRFRVYVDLDVERRAGEVSQGLGDFSGLIGRRSGRSSKSGVEEIVGCLGLSGQTVSEPYYIIQY